MPQCICEKCKVTMELKQVGAAAVEMEGHPGEAVRVWFADGFQCLICGWKCVTNFAPQPVNHIGRLDFAAYVERLKDSPLSAAGWLILFWRKPVTVTIGTVSPDFKAYAYIRNPNKQEGGVDVNE